MPPTRLTPLDASFLRVETPTAHMHVAWRARFAPAPARPPVTLDRLQRHIASRLGGAPRFRQRLAFPPGGLSEPVWVDDAGFDIRRHVVAGPDAVRTRDEFAAACDRSLSTAMDRRHPLWRLELFPGLSDGSVGLLMKAHHAMVDGMSGVALALLLLDVDPDAPEPPAEPPGWSPERLPHPVELAAGSLADAGLRPLRAVPRLGGTLRRAALAAEDTLRPAPSSYVNAPIGPERVLVGHTTRLPPLLRLKEELGVTLNDLVLCVVAGALRQLALERGVAPAPLKVLVPVSRRSGAGAADLGNQIAFVTVRLPVHARRAGDRLAAVHAETTAFKQQDRARAGEALFDVLGFLPSALHGAAARMAASPRAYNLVVSNVPGPRFPVYLLGAELREALPVIPLSDGHALSVGAFTAGERLNLSGYADPGALPEARSLPGAFCQAELELLSLARTSGGRPRAAAGTAS